MVLDFSVYDKHYGYLSRNGSTMIADGDTGLYVNGIPRCLVFLSEMCFYECRYIVERDVVMVM